MKKNQLFNKVDSQASQYIHDEIDLTSELLNSQGKGQTFLFSSSVKSLQLRSATSLRPWPVPRSANQHVACHSM